jgi:hypothetical protein
MRITAKWLWSFGFVASAIIAVVVFQNCAKAKFNDPNPRYSLMTMGMCQECGDNTGRGIACRASKQDAFPACVIESCFPGYKYDGGKCVPVICEAGTIANCPVPHGDGRMTCNPSGQGYGTCSAVDCESGYTLTNGACVAVEGPLSLPTPTPTPSPFPEETPVPTPTATPVLVCTPASHRDCSSDSTFGIQTCSDDGAVYGNCVFGDCKPGYNKADGGECVPNICEPSTITPCTIGAAVGFKTCNSQGAGWGVCEINGCQQGYVLKDGVCTVQVCTPGQQSVCEFANGSGTKTCNQDGTNYGPCNLVACTRGYSNQEGQCKEQQCVPSSQDICVGESGTGVMYCYENGMGHGPCNLNKCDEGFKLNAGQCVANDYCNAGETLACTQQFGTGVRTCDTNSHKLGPCELTACNPGYQLVNQNGNACKKIK